MMKRILLTMLGCLAASLLTIGCQSPSSGMEEVREAKFAVDENGVGTGSVQTTNEEVAEDGSTNKVTVGMTNLVSYTERTESKTKSPSVLSKQEAANLATDRRTAMGGRLKTGLGAYKGETQPDAIKAAVSPVTEIVKAYLEGPLSGSAKDAAGKLLKGTGTADDVDEVLATEPPDDVKSDLEKLKDKLTNKDE